MRTPEQVDKQRAAKPLLRLDLGIALLILIEIGLVGYTVWATWTYGAAFYTFPVVTEHR